MKILLLLIATVLFNKLNSFDLQGCDPDLVDYGGLFALCPYKDVAPFNINYNQYAVQFSLHTNHVPNCANNLEIWGLVRQAQALCADVAVSAPKLSLVDAKNPSQGLKIDFLPNTVGETTYQLSITLGCNPDIINPLETDFKVTDISTTDGTGLSLTQNNLLIQVTGASAYGCPVVSFGGIYNFASNLKTPFFIAVALIGLLFALYGIRLFKIIVFLIVFVLATVLFIGLLYEFSTFGTRPETLWVILAFSVLMGIFLGITAIKITGFCYFVLGATLGGIGGSIIYHAVLAPLLKDTAGTAPYYIVIGILAVVVGIIYVYIFKGIIIISTALIGAYIFVRAISEFIGGFPSATSLGNGIDEFTPKVYGYLAGIIVITGIGIYVQYYHSKPDKKEDKREKGDAQETERLL